MKNKKKTGVKEVLVVEKVLLTDFPGHLTDDLLQSPMIVLVQDVTRDVISAHPCTEGPASDILYIGRLLYLAETKLNSFINVLSPPAGVVFIADCLNVKTGPSPGSVLP